MNELIFSQRLYFRKLDISTDNLNMYLNWLKDTSSNSFIVSARSDYTMVELLEYIKEKNNSESALLFGIFLSSDASLIGTIKLEPIDFTSKEAWLGMMIGDVRKRGLGFGIESLNAILNFAKLDLHLNRIYLGVNRQNHPAISLYKKVGFKYIDEMDLGYKMGIEFNDN